MDIPKSTNGECEKEKVFETTNSIAEPPTGTICQKDNNNYESIKMENTDTINEPNANTDLDEMKNQNFHQNLDNIVTDDKMISHDDGQNGIIEQINSIDQPGINDNNCAPPVVNDEFNHLSSMVKQTAPQSIPIPSSNSNNNHTNKRKSEYQIESNIDEKKVHNMRRNIRGVINETNFDSITINAQREESERLARVQGLKKLVKQKYLHSALESMVEGVHEVQDDDFLAACEPVEAPSQLQIKKTTFDLKEKLQRLEEKKSDKIHWNEWLSAEAKDPPISAKKEEVVTIDSSSDEDDCIILSDSDEDCLDDEADDHHNSGLHVRDVLNIPNEHGKVMVNVGHVESEPDIFLAPQIAKVIKPHQIGGVRFLFDNIIESTKRFNTSSGFGCILAHSMGLGKTLQVVSFSDIFLRHTDSKTILCVMPINTIQNWVKEYNLWIPEESPCHETIRPRNFKVFALNDQHKTMSSRSKVIARWYAEGGVLLIGYELFRVLGLKIIKRRDGKKSLESNEHKKLLDNMHAALVKPGPDLVICDEGHRIKNAHAGISIALKQIRTRRRIVLTGYPLQNNLLEYWCMVDFVRPNYLGSKTEFCNMFERPIQNGQCIDSTPEDIKLMRYRAHVLHSLLVGFVQRRSDSVLQNSLPQKLEYVILTKMTKFQRQLYDAFMNEVVRKRKVPNPLKAFAVCCKIWNHPDVLYNFVKKRESDLDLDIDEQDTAVKSSTSKPKAGAKSTNEFGPLTVFGNEAFPSTATAGLDFHANSSNSLWPDGESNPVDAQQQHPKLVGMLKGQPPLSNTSKCSSSEIVDLDTKEVQFVKSDLNVDLEVSGNIQSSGSFEQNNTSAATTVAKPIIKMETKAGNDTISYDWAIALIKDYEPGIVSTSPKMQIFIHILEESIKLGDRVLVFSQSLLTLNLMETFLQGLIIPETDKHWKKNVSYFRLDGSTSSLDRERLVNEFNSNIEVKLFLISTRAGSLGINLTGANRVVVFDASWNPCHDTQAVHRIYRYGQGKPCFVYRIVMDNCLEKNIYDRQVKKQGMSDRVVDECNPDAHLSIKELTNLCYDKAEEDESNEFKQPIENYTDDVMRSMLTQHKSILSKEPFYHESLLIDRKEKKLSQTEKKLAKRGYEIEKKASTKPHHFIHNIHNVHNMVQNRDCMINKVNTQIFKNRIIQPFNKNSNIKMTRWIPAEVWQRQGMSSQEMKLPIDVAIPTNSNDSSNIVVKAGEKVMVLNSPKGVYMQLESGKIIAIKTSAEAAKDKMLQAKKIASSLLLHKKPIKEGTPRVAHEQASEDSENDDCIVINDSINDSSDNSFESSSYTSPKNRTDLTPVKQHKQQLTPPTQTFPKTMPTVPPEAQKDKPITANQPQQSILKPQSQTAPALPKAPTASTTATNHQYQKDKEDPLTQRNLYVQENSNQLMQSPHIAQEKPDSALSKPNFGHHTTDISPQSHHFPPHENPHHPMRMDKPAESIIPNHHNFETKPKLESVPSSANNYIHKQSNYMYGSSANYDMIPAQHNMVENQHYQAMATPQRWENKSPDLYKQAFKISNIPAPYPSTAVCDLSLFEKNEKPQPHPINESVNAEHYSSRPSYPPVCKTTEEPPYHHNLNYNLNYQNNNPHSSIMQPPPQLPPPTEDNGTLNALYHYNNKTENTYSENLYDNTEASSSSASSSSHTNYNHHHQQMSKYSYGYYQPPPYLPNYASASSNNSNKPYDNNTFPSVSNPYSYMRRPAAYSTNSMNGVDVGYNYADHQGWMKKHLPE